MTKIDKAVAIMNAVSGYERYKSSKGDKFIEDTKTDSGYFPEEFISCMIFTLYSYTQYFSKLPKSLEEQINERWIN